MDKQTISFRLDGRKVEALDTLAETLDRDRSYLLNEAVDAYLEVQQWQIEQIKQGRQQVADGESIDHAIVKEAARSWRKK